MDGAMIIGRVTTVTLRGAQTPPIRPKAPGLTSCRSAQRCPSSRSMREIQPSLEEVSGPKNHEMTENNQTMKRQLNVTSVSKIRKSKQEDEAITSILRLTIGDMNQKRKTSTKELTHVWSTYMYHIMHLYTFTLCLQHQLEFQP